MKVSQSTQDHVLGVGCPGEFSAWTAVIDGRKVIITGSPCTSNEIRHLCVNKFGPSRVGEVEPVGMGVGVEVHHGG